MTKGKNEKESFSEREEYILTRNVYIEWDRNSSNNLQNVIILVSTWWFVYTQSLYKNQISSCILLTSYIFFAIGLISSILSFYLSWKSHQLQRDIYDMDYSENPCKFCRDQLQKKLNNINFLINIVELSWVATIILGIICIIISFF